MTFSCVVKQSAERRVLSHNKLARKSANKVFLQGVFAWLGDVIIIGILGSLLLVAYSKIAGKSGSLTKED